MWALLLAALLVAGEGATNYWNHPAIAACCSEADATISDDYQIQADGSVIAVVTRATSRTESWAPIGRTYHIPADRVVTVAGNPLGAAIVFIRPGSLTALCFAMGPMI